MPALQPPWRLVNCPVDQLPRRPSRVRNLRRLPQRLRQPLRAAPARVVDVAVILDGLAAKNPEKLDWKKSIVDLMKLVGMDSSLGARKQLAKELNYTGDPNDSASMNVWLHKEVLIKLSENGGKVPEELLR